MSHQNDQTIKDMILQQIERMLDPHFSMTADDLLDVLHDLGQYVDVDRITIFLFNEFERKFQLYLEWCHLGIIPRDQHMVVHQKDEDPFMDQLLKHEIDIEDVDKTSLNNSWLSYIHHENIKAFYAFPLHVNEHFLGYMSFENQRRPDRFESLKHPSLKSLIQLISFKFSYLAMAEDIKHIKDDNENSPQFQYTFVSNFSHEVKTPLNGIQNALYLMQTTDITKEQKSYMDMAQTSADHLSQIVERMLDLEALQADSLEIFERSFNLEDEMMRLYRMHHKAIHDKQLNLEIHFDYDIHHDVIGDDRKLRHILSHIIDNAIKFTEEGTISLSVKKIDDTYYQFKIQDSGIGIPQEKIDQLYKAFHHLRSEDNKVYQGLGLGLSVSYQLTRLLGGQLKVESIPNQGSTFTCEIPLKQGQEQSYKEVEDLLVLIYHDNQPSELMLLCESMGMHVYDEQSIEHEKVDLMIFETMLKQGENLTHIKEQYGTEQVMLFALKHIDQRKLKKVDGTLEEPVSRHALLQKIVNRQHELRRSITSEYTKQLSGVALIVDDNRLNRVALQSILQKLGIQSKLAESGQKAIEMIKQESFDLILMDIQMPHMDGLEATRRIRSLGNSYQKVPIIAVTANAYFNDYDLLKASQINDVIFKPIKMEALAQSLRKYLVQNETIRIPDELFIFDRGDFLKRFEGSYDIAKEVIITFQSEYLKDIEKMRQAVKEKNPETIIQTAHYYKGSCAYLSGKRLVWVLTRMMDHAKQNILDEMNDLFELIVKESESLINELQTMKALG